MTEHLPHIANLQPYVPFGHGDLPRLPLGLRLVQAYFVAVLVACLGLGAYLNPNGFTYDLSMVCALLLSGTACVSVWLIQIRSKRAPRFIIAALVVTSVLIAWDLNMDGAIHSLSNVLGGHAARVLVGLQFVAALAALSYIVTSQRARAALSCGYDYAEVAGGHTWELPFLKRIRTWEFWRDLALYFVAFSFLGHWAEIAFCWLIRFGLVMGDYDPSNLMLWEQWLFPFSAEGIALVMIVVVLHPLSRWLLKKFNGSVAPALVASFFANALVCTSIDFTTGITANYDYHLWDYRSLPFNFMGQVCLQNSIVYSVAATLIVWVFYPLMDKALRRLPKVVVDGAFWFLMGVYGFCAVLHFMYFDPTGFVLG